MNYRGLFGFFLYFVLVLTFETPLPHIIETY
jgi:hypothetical protein